MALRKVLSPEPDGDFVYPENEYEMLLEEDATLPEGVSSKTGDVSSYAEKGDSEEFVADACALVLGFRDIFSTDLSSEPADLPPQDVHIDNIDTAKWHQPKIEPGASAKLTGGRATGDYLTIREAPRTWGNFSCITRLGLLSRAVGPIQKKSG